MRSLLVVLVLYGCAGYQIEPYAEYQLRDEGFDPKGGASEYSGNTYRVGLRYRAPSKMDENQFIRLEHALHHPGTPAPVREKPGDDEDELKIPGLGGAADMAKGFKYWPQVGALAVILAFLSLLAWLKWGRKRASPVDVDA